MHRSLLPQAKSSLREILFRDGIRAAVVFLNGLTGHRFTALYRFGDAHLRNVYFFDRDNPGCETTEDVPLSVTFCVLMRDSHRPLRIADAPADERVADHPSRQVVQSYCGVPLIDEAGRMFGSLCHFDTRPNGSDEVDIELMESMGDLLRERERRLRSAPADHGGVVGRPLFSA